MEFTDNFLSMLPYLIWNGLVLFPLVVGLFLILLSYREENESQLAGLAKAGMIGNLVIVVFSVLARLEYPETVRFSELGVFFENHAHGLKLEMIFDSYSGVGLLATALVFGLVGRFSRFYLHRERGFGRYFAVLFLLLSGVNVLLTAGNPEVFFAGWEIIGTASFLLIGFYYQRKQPLKNALWVYLVYRFCDVGFLVGGWLSRQEVSTGVTFADPHAFSGHWILPLGILMLLAAAGKSAQFPFSTWIQKAVEGPTPSSAVFYGALSIHAGVFLLLRFSFLWESSTPLRVVMGFMGALSAWFAHLFSIRSSNIKGQIAYASASQVGLMWIELALGFNAIVGLHLLGNLFLRCYQFLVSPWAGAMLVRDIRRNYRADGNSFGTMIQTSLNVFSVNEGYFDSVLRRFFLIPFRKIQRRLIEMKWEKILVPTILGTLFLVSHFQISNLTNSTRWFLQLLFFGASVLIAVVAVAKEGKTVTGLSFSSLAGVGIAVQLIQPSAQADVEFFVKWLFLGGILDFTGALGSSVTRSKKLKHIFNFMRIVGVATMIGFPITGTFFAEDLIVNHLLSTEKFTVLLAIGFTWIFVLNGFNLMRALFTGKQSIWSTH